MLWSFNMANHYKVFHTGEDMKEEDAVHVTALAKYKTVYNKKLAQKLGKRKYKGGAKKRQKDRS